MNIEKITKRLCAAGLAGVLALAPSVMQASENNPVASKDAVVLCGNARFTVLTPEMIRIEYSDKGAFEDRATFTIVNRNLDDVDYTKTEDADYLYISTPKLELKYRKGTDPRVDSSNNLSIKLLENDAVWHPGMKDPLNLKGTTRTLDSSNGDNKRADMEDGVISRSGWAVIDDSWSNTRPDGSRSFAMEPNAQTGYDWWTDRADKDALDLYFMGYGKNYKKAVSDYTKVAGRIPLPPDYVFGYWYSKYSVYSSDDYRQIMDDIEENNIPADVMILDMDWHWNKDNHQSGDKGGWTGWSFNTNLIPDPKGLLDEIHDRKFRTALNLHPADGVNSHESPEFFAAMVKDLNGKYLNDNKDNIEWSLDFPDFTTSFFNNVIRDHERTGVDFWWIDWQQHLTSKLTEDLGETFWCNHVFFNEMDTNRKDRRPVIFHRWGGLGSHRYQIGFSGDSFINFPTLAFQPYFTATASNVGYGYWGHDLGGHMINDEKAVNDPDLVSRWIQFGVFTPIFRTHATNDARIERRMWKFDNFPVMLEAVRLRYSLFPYIYTMARKTYDTGISMCRPLYYEYPDAEEAYTYENQYFFGDDILVAPIVEPAVNGISTKQIWLPEGEWWSASTNEMLKGPGLKTMQFNERQIPYFFKAGSIIPYNPETVMSVTERPDNMVLNITSGADGSFTLYEDSGDNRDYDTAYATTLLTQTNTKGKSIYTIGGRQGDSTGLTAERSYTLHIYNVSSPKQVKIDGKKVKTFSYDAATRTATIDVPKTPCTTAVNIEVKYK